MDSLAGFEIIEKISTTTRVSVVRARRLVDQRIVLLKALNSQYPSVSDIARLKQEFFLLKETGVSHF